MFRKCTVFSLFRKERNARHFAFAETMRGNRITINISPLCGDDSIHIFQGINRRTFEAKLKGRVNP